ncbi:MAG: MFS transporter [Rhizobiaceae bacterium]
MESASNGQPASPTFCPAENRRYVLVAAILASALGFIDGSVVAIAMPAIRSDIGATLAGAQWISNGYMLTLSALILVGGAAGDRFGLRRVFASGIALFVASSVLCALAPGQSSLILFRMIQGLGAAFMVPGSLTIIARAYPKAERGKAIGIWAASSALTTAIGPVIGGALISSFGDSAWRIIFAVNLPLGGAALYLLAARVPADTPAGRRALDGGGAVLATAALGALAFGLTAFGNGDGERAAFASLFVIAGILLLAGFALWERRCSRPMIDLSLFGNRAFTGANLATFFLYFGLSANLFYLPMFAVAAWGISEAETGFIFLPLSGLIALLSSPVGKLTDRTGPRLPIALGSLVVAAAFAGLAALSALGLRYFWTGIFPLMVVFGLGMSLVVSPLSAAVMTVVDDKDTGAASGINNAVSRVAGLIAVAAMGAVAAWRYRAVLDGAGSLSSMPGFGEKPAAVLPQALEAARVAASEAAFSGVAWTIAALSLLSAFIAWRTVPGGAERPDPRNAPGPSAGDIG